MYSLAYLRAGYTAERRREPRKAPSLTAITNTCPSAVSTKAWAALSWHGCALSTPVNAQAQLLAPASAENAPNLQCTIKGNINRKGERFYHLPGGYAKINMAVSGKRWFCTEDEAMAAGWRRAAR